MSKASTEGETPDDHKAKVLLVDDRPDKLLALEALLANTNATFVKAGSGRDALRLLLRDNFALILLDVSMPGMDGFETAALIRQRPKTEHTPIIFITSINTNETHISQGYSLGAVDYIFTPIVSEVLKAKVAVFIDLHEKNETIRRQAETIAREAERRADNLELRLRNLLNHLNVGVFRATVEGKIVEANPALFRILGIETTTPNPLEEISKVGELTDQISATTTMTNTPVDIQLTNSSGRETWLSLTRTMITLEGQTFIKGLVEDITLRKQKEKELYDLNETLERRVAERTEALHISQQNLARAERLASLGTLAAGIAHEINNPLNSILGLCEYALRKEDLEFYQSTVETTIKETRRCGKIIRGVLQFAKNERSTKTPHDLNSVVIHSIDLINTYVKTPLKVKLEREPGEILVEMNPTEIEQVLINILMNAAEASPKAAEVTIAIQKTEKKVLLVVTDRGPGIKKEVMGKIFDPFFSTRSEKGGTGLGLSVAHGIIEAHAGKLEVQSEEGEGTCFRIELPYATSLDVAVSNNGARKQQESIGGAQ
jgi:PAS domain S-box-containing protein